MQGVTSKETHFQCVTSPIPTYFHISLYLSRLYPAISTNLTLPIPHIHPPSPARQTNPRLCDSVTITSSAFESKMQPARHRLVYALLKDELSQEGGIHALQLKTKTPAEEAREAQK